MSNVNLTRRTELMLTFDGSDISRDINAYLLSMYYTDNEEDKADDLQLEIDDREGIWLKSWLNTPSQPTESASSTSGFNIGDEITVNGRPQYTSYGGGTPGKSLTNYKGNITYLNFKSGAKYPIHVDQKGWFAENQVIKISAKQDTITKKGGAKGAQITAIIIQKNWESDGNDRLLDCGIFEVDSVSASGPPAQISIKATSIPSSSTIRTQKKNKAWQKIKLSAIANDIARKNGLKCMFLSAFDPVFERKEQVKQSDISFLQSICKSTGISLKVTAKTIVLFDAAEYEQKNAVRAIERGKADIISYSFSTNLNDTAYSKCHVSYTDPLTQKIIEYTYTPRNAEPTGQVLEISEKVTSKDEARQLAMKRLRQKNKAEYVANFTIVGDTRLVAGVTVNVSGYGFFDGKYIIESATHSLSNGYTVKIKLRLVLDGY